MKKISNEIKALQDDIKSLKKSFDNYDNEVNKLRKISSNSIKRSNLELIVFAVKQLKDAIEFGFQKNVASRSLNITLNHHWQAKEVGSHIGWHKERFTHSLLAKKEFKKLGKKSKLIMEHVVPMNVIIDMLLNLEPLNETNVKKILSKFWKVIRITKSEDLTLNKLGLNRKMPKDWDGKDPLARYKKAKIEF